MFVSMSNSVLGSVFMKDGAVTLTLSKKPRKKRHRNKLKNSNLRKKRLKKHVQNNKKNSFLFNYSNFNSESEKIMSNWYWTNYKKAMEWQNRHQVAHWKATALALFEENRYLLQVINNMQHGLVCNGLISQKKLCKGGNLKKNKFKINPVIIPGSSTQMDDTDIEDDEAVEDEDENDNEEQQECNENMNDDDDDDDDDFEIEMSEEMMQFFEQSYKRKMDLEKFKEKELLKTTEEKVEQLKINKRKRTSEMSFLYGEGASMIIGMETAVQLSFDKYCDGKSPKYWPNIPFRL